MTTESDASSSLATMTIEDQFKAAVKVITSLPKNGHFQPSNEVKLRFYGYFKQATEGPNKTAKPAFYDIVARHKWEAWKRLNTMSKEEAMANYVEELKKIVETMSYSEQIADFLDVLGPFYELVNESPKKQLKMNGDIPTNGKDLYSGVNKSDFNFNSKGFIPSNGLESGDSSERESDGEEFSDTFDHIANGNTANIDNFNGFDNDIISARGEVDVSTLRVSSASASSRPSGSRSYLNRGVSNPTVSDPTSTTSGRNGSSGGGGSGGPHYVANAPADVNEQIALAILRLQQSLDQINSRVNAIETRLNTTSAFPVPSGLKKWWPFSICPKTMAVLLVWPFVVHFALNALKERRRK